MNILAIGNSFSEDAAYYFTKIAASAGKTDVKLVNLYIGGCSLEMHENNIINNNRVYEYHLNGNHTNRVVSIKEALCEEDWDIVITQQQSAKTAIYESYNGHLKAVINYIKENAPNAEIYFFQTWAYEIDRVHPDFELFNNNQQLMHKAIVETVARVCKENGDLPIIPAGEVINEVRQTKEFDYKNGGQTLCRDGFHMHLIYGRYLLGLVWFATLLSGNIDDVTFIPSKEDIVNGYSVPDFYCDGNKINIIKECVKK